MTTSWIGKCRTRGCRTALRVDDAADSIRSQLSTFTYAASGAEATETGIGYCIGNYGAHARCAEHGLFKLAELKGRLNVEKTCNARCTGATGASCDCSCGGANHGANHG